MPVDTLSVVEGPLAGLGQEPHACNLICQTCSWMDNHGVSPAWTGIGFVLGGWRGAFGTSAGSWLYRRVVKLPTDSLFGLLVATGLALVLDRRR
jgi:hypothetical protein